MARVKQQAFILRIAGVHSSLEKGPTGSLSKVTQNTYVSLTSVANTYYEKSIIFLVFQDNNKRLFIVTIDIFPKSSLKGLGIIQNTIKCILL